MMISRPLTHDEKKASEAAFRGMPFNPDWSQSAKSVYDGIVDAMEKSSTMPLIDTTQPPDISELGVQPISVEPKSDTSILEEDEASETVGSIQDSMRRQIRSRREAIESGFLMDVTPTAQSLGMDLAVGMTKPLWDHGITSVPDLSEEEISGRVRDVLLAVRLRLANLQPQTPIIEIPILLSLPPDPIPQVFQIYALFHKDPDDSDCLLLIHPGEVAFANRSNLQN